jgi:hypothetical protein
MIKKLNHWGYYVIVTPSRTIRLRGIGELCDAASRWGVRIEGGGFTSYEAGDLPAAGR